MSSNAGVKVTKKNLQDVIAGVVSLARAEILVGVPEETTERDDPESKSAGITNASLAYIHDNGMPEQHIPARPFMIPGITKAKPEIERRLSAAMRAAMRGNTMAAEQQMIAAGLAAQLSIQKTIQQGVPPPLAMSTLRARAAKGRKGAALEISRRERGLDPMIGMALAKPLIDTGEMEKSIKYVIRQRSKRR